jgi:hypothetical protein
MWYSFTARGANAQDGWSAAGAVRVSPVAVQASPVAVRDSLSQCGIRRSQWAVRIVRRSVWRLQCAVQTWRRSVMRMQCGVRAEQRSVKMLQRRLEGLKCRLAVMQRHADERASFACKNETTTCAAAAFGFRRATFARRAAMFPQRAAKVPEPPAPPDRSRYNDRSSPCIVVATGCIDRFRGNNVGVTRNIVDLIGRNDNFKVGHGSTRTSEGRSSTRLLLCPPFD